MRGTAGTGAIGHKSPYIAAMPKPAKQAAAPKPVAAKALAKGDHVFLVDGSSYIFRAYHALPPLNRKSTCSK